MHESLAVMAALGFAVLVMAWLPSVSKKINISYPVLLLLMGFFLYSLKVPLLWSGELWSDAWIMHISEFVVIISLMGVGLKIGKNYSLKSWKTPLKLILITMPMCMGLVFLTGFYFLALTLPAALLIAAVLAPTDPVLAEEVQIESADEKKGTHSEFTITGEAGLNDGLAFPFTFMAVLVAQAGSWAAFSFGGWLIDEFFLKIIIGLGLGFVIGKSIGYAIEKIPQIAGIRNPHAYIGLAITFMTYGVTELLHGYGFLAVFVAALTIRHQEEVEGSMKEKMHDFVQAIEHLLLVLWIILFGGAILDGALSAMTWKEVVFALGLIVVIRPIAGFAATFNLKNTLREKFIISFYGIRGIGSVFYISWAFMQTDAFGDKTYLYGLVCLVVLCSILIHGLTAPYVVKR
jgi:NhaP-type Na+/H+ or K+/H+ antiporter